MDVLQGAHGVWELSVNKVHHADMVEELLEALVAQLANPDLQVRDLPLGCCCQTRPHLSSSSAPVKHRHVLVWFRLNAYIKNMSQWQDQLLPTQFPHSMTWSACGWHYQGTIHRCAVYVATATHDRSCLCNTSQPGLLPALAAYHNCPA